jgi:parvulin-like peptidyl-prolyl isomerase
MKDDQILSSLIAIVFLCLAVACSDSGNNSVADNESMSTPEDTLFLVNDSPVTDSELDYAVQRFFGDQFVDQRAVKQIEQSLIASRALSQKALQELDIEILKDIELAVSAYREERLIAKYIEETTTPEHVSSSEVKAYYDANLESFGAKVVRELEVIEIDRAGSDQSLTEISSQLQSVSELDSWDGARLPEASKQYHIRTAAHIPPRILSAANALGIGETSGVIIEKDKVYLVRVTDITELPAKPIETVSVEIRQRLAAVKLKQHIKALSDQIIEESTIVPVVQE